MPRPEKTPISGKRNPHVVPMEQAMDSRALAKHHVIERGESKPPVQAGRKARPRRRLPKGAAGRPGG